MLFDTYAIADRYTVYIDYRASYACLKASLIAAYIIHQNPFLKASNTS